MARSYIIVASMFNAPSDCVKWSIQSLACNGLLSVVDTCLTKLGPSALECTFYVDLSNIFLRCVNKAYSLQRKLKLANSAEGLQLPHLWLRAQMAVGHCSRLILVLPSSMPNL